MKWPQQFLNERAQQFLKSVPQLMARIEYLEAEVKRLESEKAGKRGRKNASTT